jgi:hypothetical protein
MNRRAVLFFVVLPVATLTVRPGVIRAATAAAMDPATCPMHAQHVAEAGAAAVGTRAGEVDARGESTMGFSQSTNRHEFLLTDRGGVIRVRADRGEGFAAGRDAARNHLALLPPAFSRGDFSMPQTIHGFLPPGAETMARLAAKIRYAYAEREDGGEVSIETEDVEAKAAIRAFLRFQIEDHRTGDPLEEKHSER